MLQKLRNLFASGKAVSSFFRVFGNLSLYEFRNYESYLEAGSRKLWASWKAMDIVATQVMATPVVVHRKGSNKPVEVKGLSQLLQYANQMETFADLLYKYVFHMKMTGMAFWLKSQPNPAGNRPLEIFALNPGRIKYVVSAVGEVTGFIYYSGREPIPLSLDEVIIFKRPHPNNDFYGLGDFEPAEDMLQEAINRQNYQKAFFKNGAAPTGILICEDNATDEETFKAAQRKWQSEFGLEKNAGKVGWLAGRWKYERLGLTAQEMQDLDRTKFTIEQIFMLHGVPMSIAGVRDAANYATADVEDKNFRRYTVYPLIKILEDTLNSDLVQGYGENLILKFQVAGLNNIGQIILDLAPLFDRGGISINEMREKAGLERIENPLFEQHFILSAYTPADLAGIANQDQVQAQAQRMLTDFVQKALASKTTNT